MILLFKKTSLKTLLIILFIGNGSNLWANPINDVLQHVQKNNQEIKIAKQELKIAKINFLTSISNFLPNINASFQQGKQQNNAKNIDRGELDKLQDLETYTLTITQPVFKGFQNYNTYRIEESRFNEAKLKFYETQNQIFLKTISAYLNLAKSQKLLKLQNDKILSLKRELKLISKRTNKGYASKSEKLASQIKINIAVSELKKFELENDKNLQNYLEIVGRIDANLDINSIANLLDIDSIDLIVETALENNHTILQEELKLKQSKSEYHRAKGKFAPEANIVFQRQNQENMAYINNRDLDNTSYYLEVSLPIFQKGSEYFEIKKTSSNVQLSETKLSLSRSNIETEIINKFNQINFSKNLLDQLEQKLWLYKQNLKQNKKLITQGQIDPIEKVKIETEIIATLKEITEAKSNFIFYHQELKLLKGDNLL